MIMSYTKKITLILTLFYGAIFYAQENFTGYLEPSFAVNYKVTDTYSHNFSFVNRNYFFNDEAYQLTTRHVEFVHFSDLKIKPNQSISLGIQYRFRENFEPDSENELRLMQQYNRTFKPRIIRYGFRFRSEQRIQPSLTRHRFRLRFTTDFPLQGENLDVKEMYLVSSTESLLTVAKANKPSFDQRFTTHIGYFLSEDIKIQAGLEYRFEDYYQKTEHVLFFTTGLFLSL